MPTWRSMRRSCWRCEGDGWGGGGFEGRSFDGEWGVVVECGGDGVEAGGEGGDAGVRGGGESSPMAARVVMLCVRRRR